MVPLSNNPIPANYGGLLKELKSRIQSARVKAALAANAELIHLYWDMGRMIVDQQEKEGWGKSVVERLSQDLQSEFPDQKGLSPRNIWMMRQFYLEWIESSAILSQFVAELEHAPQAKLQQLLGEILSQPAREFLQRPVAEIGATGKLPRHVRELDAPQILLRIVREIPWGQNIDLISKLKDPRQRLWYALKTIENGWSRAVLTAQIESGLIDNQGAALTNFNATLPGPQSDLAQGILKDRYLLDFIAGGEAVRERDLENQLATHMTRFLVELGKGFAYVGRQYRITVGGDEFFIDLLFYHVRLHSYIVIELKTGRFEPEFSGKMNFYLEAIDRQVRTERDGPTLGLILCKEKNNVVVEYALARADRPMGVATWEFSKQVPKELQDALPTAAELEQEFRGEEQVEADAL